MTLGSASAELSLVSLCKPDLVYSTVFCGIFFPLFLASLCAAFPKPKLSGFELTTAVPSAVPWEGDVVLHGCNKTAGSA